MKPLYYVRVDDGGLFIAIRDGKATIGSFPTLAEAKATCQAHADAKAKRPAVEPKPEPPAIEWPEGVIAIIKNESQRNFWIGPHRSTWCHLHTGPDPFPPGLDWRKCFIINPACK